jgi:RNA polymerase sigma-70 factor (ECF subfamily)
MPEQLDPALIAQAQSGNAAAIGKLYETFHGGVHRFLYYRVGDRQTAEDLTAEVFFRMLEALPRYRHGEIPIRAWIYRIARNLVIDHYRKMSVRDHQQLDESLSDPGVGPESTAERRLTSERLYHALLELTEDQRDVIVMRFVAEMPIAQVAEAVEKSETAVKALQRRGLRALRKILKNWNVKYG